MYIEQFRFQNKYKVLGVMSLEEAAKNVCILNPFASEFVPRTKVLKLLLSYQRAPKTRKRNMYIKSTIVFNHDYPLEVVQLIFRFLGHKDLFKCRLVSR